MLYNEYKKTDELWKIVCNTVKEGVCSIDELDGIINLAQNIFDFDVEDRLISEGVVSSDIRYRHYSADDL